MATLIQDLRYGLRVLRNSPGFAAIAVLTLALGIGANVAMFSFVDELWLHPMPVPHPERLVRIFTSSPTADGDKALGGNSIPDGNDLRAGSRTLSGVALLERRGAFYDDGSQTRLVSAAVVSDNFFDVLQPMPAQGRTFTAAELRSPAVLPVMISYPFWRRAFAADPAIAGHSIILNHRPVVVLGVLPRSFRGTQPLMVPDVWIPFTTWFQQHSDERYRQTDRASREYDLYGRLSEGATLSQARAELSSIAAQLATAYPGSNSGRKLTVVSEQDSRGEGIANLGLILLGVAVLVLLIACANVAGLLIARGEYRRREMAVRIALGGTRARIVRQLLTETTLLAIAGGAAALLLGRFVLQALPSLLPQSSFPVGVDAYVSWRGLVVTAGTVIASLFLFALTPALLATRFAPASGLKCHAGGTGTVRAVTRSALVVSQVALSLVLAVCTGLLVVSLWKGLKLNPGFDSQQSMLLADFSPGMNSSAQNMQLTEELRQRMQALPGVSGTTAALRIPLGMSGGGRRCKVFSRQSPASAGDGITIHYAPVGDHYFEVLRTRILRGRAIDRRDLETGARVVVVNQQMATRLWPDQNPIGRQIRLGDDPHALAWEVVGVAENGKYNEIQEETMAYFFLPMRPDDYGEVEMAIKTASDPTAMAVAFRQNLRALNPNAAIVELVTLRQHMRQALYVQSLSSRLISALGLLGLALAGVGIYGLMSFVVGKRTQEIGIRLALGAERSAIFRLMLRYALKLAAAGVIIGAAAAVPAGQAMRALLVGVGPGNVAVFGSAILVLLIVAFFAALAPSLRALRVDPIVALRDE